MSASTPVVEPACTAKRFQSIKGFYDLLPGDTALWRYLETTAARVLAQYAYRMIQLPLVEYTGLFVRGVGEHTDVVEKEMYSWRDPLNGDALSLRPEGTAGCARAVIEHNLTYAGPQRLWYQGPMFRHENVQKGRQRQFHQIGVEAFADAGPAVDAEQIILLARLWRELGIAHGGNAGNSDIHGSKACSDDPILHLNTIGSMEERAAYRQTLVDHFHRYTAQLDADERERLARNPLRLLDSKRPELQEVIAAAPRLIDTLSPESESRRHFVAVCARLDDAGVTYRIDPRLVRGLDYYNRTVFEWVSSTLGAQGTIAGGGRYDGLIERLGGKPTPACGFAMGLERIFLLLRAGGITKSDAPTAYLVNLGEAAATAACLLAEKLRDAGIAVQVHGEPAQGMKAQMKHADRSGARYALLLGEDELAQQRVTVKPLRGGEQCTMTREALVSFLSL